MAGRTMASNRSAEVADRGGRGRGGKSSCQNRRLFMPCMPGRRCVWASSSIAWPKWSPGSPNSTAPMRRLNSSGVVVEAFQAHSAPQA